jgi:hypothetical protein
MDYKAMMLMGVAAVITLIGKIVWDWLKNRREPKESWEEINARLSVVETQVVSMNKRLDEGREDFKAIRKDITKICTNIAIISAIVKERSSTDRALFQQE